MRGDGFPDETNIDYLEVLRCFEELLPRKVTKESHVIQGLLQTRIGGRVREREAAIATGLIKTYEAMNSSDGGKLDPDNSFGLSSLLRPQPTLQSWWTALNHRTSLVLNGRDTDTEKFPENLGDFRISLEDIINYLRPRDQIKLLESLQKARLLRNPSPGYRDLILKLPMRVRTALLPAARSMLLIAEAVMELLPQSTRARFLSVSKIPSTFSPHVYIGT